MAMAMAKLKLLLFSFFLLLHTAHSSAPPPHASFSFPSFDSATLASLLFQGDARLSSSTPRASSIELSGSSPNSSGGLFFSRPIAMSSSVSFSSSFSFSLDLLHRDSRDSLSFVVADISANAAAPSEVLAAVELDSLLADESLDAYYADLREALGRGDTLQACVEYNGARKEMGVRLAKPAASPPPTPKLSYEVDLAKNQFVYVGFKATTGSSMEQQKKTILHTWSFNSWDASQHSIPVDPRLLPQEHRHGHNLLVENAYLRAMSLLFGAVLCASLSVMALWAIVERALGSARRELAMLPVLCEYEQVSKDVKEEEGYEEEPLMMVTE